MPSTNQTNIPSNAENKVLSLEAEVSQLKITIEEITKEHERLLEVDKHTLKLIFNTLSSKTKELVMEKKNIYYILEYFKKEG